MNKDNTKKLFDKYPKIFADKPGPEYLISPCQYYGIECGDGWYNIIDALCCSIQHHIDITKCQQVIVEQIKEKFGELRFYIQGGDDTVRDLISFAEILSIKTCEICGSPGITRNKQWIQTLCNKCETLEDDTSTE